MVVVTAPLARQAVPEWTYCDAWCAERPEGNLPLRRDVAEGGVGAEDGQDG
jgi:hypothetical protein